MLIFGELLPLNVIALELSDLLIVNVPIVLLATLAVSAFPTKFP